MSTNLPENAKRHYAQQLADEAKKLVPGMERLCEIAAELRTDDLYRLLGFDTWEQFSTEYLGVSKRTANRWVDAWKKRAIPAQSAEKAISESAGQSVAAGQNVPVVESDALNSAKSSEGVDRQGETPAGPTLRTPSDQSSGGAELQPSPAGPTDEAAPKRPSSRSAPPGPNPTGPVPSLRQEASIAFEALHGAPEGIGAKWSIEEATYWENRTQREMAAFRKAYGIDQPKPERRQGTIIRPADRGTATTDPFTCAHPKDKRKHLGYIIKCEACGVKIA